jgi:hypothetical protein
MRSENFAFGDAAQRPCAAAKRDAARIGWHRFARFALRASPQQARRRHLPQIFFSVVNSALAACSRRKMARANALRRVRSRRRIATRHVKEMHIPWALLRSGYFLLWSRAGDEVVRNSIAPADRAAERAASGPRELHTKLSGVAVIFFSL